MSRPRLFIIAGPNGSGKSLFSKALSQSDYEVFDGDKHMTHLSKKFSDIGSDALWNYIDEEIFSREKAEAIMKRLNYAYETNFRSDNPMSTALEFQKNGYEIHLIFMGLNSLEESIERVAHRVRTGGHKVSEESIKYNFEHGFKNLYKHYFQFDSVTLFDNSVVEKGNSQAPRELLFISEGDVYISQENLPEWAQKLVPERK
ncbi:Zeta toxin [compost metagenome]